MAASIQVTGRDIRAARVWLGWTQEELARKAKIGPSTIKRMESFDGPVGARTDTLRRVLAVLERAGVPLALISRGS